ncbi:solute carrier family 22 member 7b.1 [Electrophorus electricus]|uniref:solute carrier family 22 member 7b.1 n=1 Tax=Electrophorus electricus TaxID=8005 RepID=UPI0015D0CCC5|nr:solute carrier family 22 member 7b.1 [Electrophorus electricus]
MKFENILAETDGFGRYQIAIITLLVFSRISLPGHFLLNNFIAAIPSHHCAITSLENEGVFGNLTKEQRLTVSIPKQEEGTFASCHMFPEPQFHLLTSSSNTSALPVIQCQNGWEYDHSTFRSTLVTQFDLVCQTKGLTKVSASIFFAGIMFGAAFYGILCDKYGRKTMLLVSIVSALVFSIASIISTNFSLFMAFRFLTGISIISIVLSLEWVDTEHRTFIAVFGSVTWTLGNLMLAGIAYVITDWRMLIVTVTAPLALAVATWGWVPESARWLIVNGRIEAAYRYLQTCARFNGRQDFTARIKPETLFAVTSGQLGHNYTYLDLIKTPCLRRLTIITGIIWYGVASTYYGISLNVTGFGLSLHMTHFIYATVELPAKVLIYFSLEKLGRQLSQVGTLVLTGVCLIINIILPKDYWMFRTSVAVLGKGLSEASFTTVFLYTTELFPTVLRQSGLGYSSFVARLGACISPLIMLLEEAWLPLPQVVFGTVAVGSGLVAFLLPETNQAQLPETIANIEQERKRSTCITTLEQGELPLKCNDD